MVVVHEKAWTFRSSFPEDALAAGRLLDPEFCVQHLCDTSGAAVPDIAPDIARKLLPVVAGVYGGTGWQEAKLTLYLYIGGDVILLTA